MAASFATYASQFLNRQQQPGTSTNSSSSQQPLFFSFSTDEESCAADPFRHGDIELDDGDDPHLRSSRPTPDHGGRGRRAEVDDEDPYLRLDEDDPPVGPASESIPLVASHDPEPTHGWLAHRPSSAMRSPSPSPSASSSGSGAPLTDFLHHTKAPVTNAPPPTRTTLSLTESLLPRDGHARPIDVFTLPDPRHVTRGRRKYNDSIWTALWCTSLVACLFSTFLVLILTHKPSTTPSGSTLPYTIILHTVPLLTVLTIVSAVASYAHILLLRIFVRPVVIATSVFIPATLFISALWAFIGSFMWDGDQESTWGETVGLRLFSLIPLTLALYTSRRLLNLPQEVHTVDATLTLTTRILMYNPFLLALSPLILLMSLIASIPFATLGFRLLLVGNFYQPFTGSKEWHISGWAGWGILATMCVWLWSWAVARGILRVTCSGVIGAWYFTNPDLSPPPPTSTHIIHAALFRATSLSLGTAVLSALLLTGIRLLLVLIALLRRAPIPILPWLSLPLSILGNLTNSLSTYALVYTGLTGDAFFPSARRSRALVAAAIAASKKTRRSSSDPMLKLLNVAPLSLTFPFALSTYLFVAHTLSAPDQALAASLLAGGVTALVGTFCVSLVEDAADTLYICFCIDRDLGEMHRQEVFDAFEGPRFARRRPSPPAVPSPDSPPVPSVLHVTTPSPALAPQRCPQPEPEPQQQMEEEEEEEGGVDSLLYPGSDIF